MELNGILAESYPTVGAILAVLGALTLGFVGAKLIVWTVFAAAVLFLFGAHPIVWIIVGVPLVILLVKPIRRILITNTIVGILKKLNILPEISETERVALEAGSTWVDKELLSGKPDFKALAREPYKKAAGEITEFLNGPVEKVCAMVDDWEVYKDGDLPQEVWDYLKKEKFFGMIIPKEYGGLGFSALANSEVVAKLSTRSGPLAITVMVPNSLGPAELLAHYGTQAQKDHYLPRLADGREIPCFALTEPGAGSDAGGMQSTGVVFKDDDGSLKIRLNWEKRYITLAAVSTVLGLAVKLRDPDNHLGKGEDLGITCLLVPSKADGVVLGQRHNPMGVPFYNCPTSGNDVVVDIDQIIGGPDYAGRGWQMLMECLAVGRSISLPAQSTGGAKYVARVAGAYSAIRKQFGLEIGKFEGIEEPLARIGGFSYLLEASRIFTVGAVDSGIKPSVVSAIAKYNSTELFRKAINDGMDILGGAAISRGKRNLLANGYISTPIGITVEGANILTRSMIIFGQGVIRCHPYAYQELKALTDGDVKGFDDNFFSHVGFVNRNLCRALLLSLTRGRLASTPGGPMKKYYRKIAWASASFSFMSDLALGSYGGGLKLREKITGRYADVLSWLYLATATLHRFEAEGRKKDHQPYAEWALQYAFAQIQEAFDGIYENIEIPVLRPLFRGPIKIWSRLNSFGGMPNDHLGRKVAAGLCKPGQLRDELTYGVYVPTDVNEALGRYEHTLKLVTEANGVYKKIVKAIKAKKLPRGKPDALAKKALEANVITKEDFDLVQRAEAARDDAIQVDSFKLEEFATNLLTPHNEKAEAANS
ncbi:acyl-CoA dehydrogenase [Pseudobacteriovorax antillogorgiicola]|uniref:Acyl-coenzyme A dehydrogenase n=1 Tax=Pseudobacteriovorax antillogorgiicola TaxID=1513793 RepID=A0A1Y6C6G5_9BACT|nr:acyl-CoA dehydrogenase [Pseudobacteriovorax antillogorgiicola]TCS49329.1 acyl-CoA dehydrogenase [Pseudobacteriovorax antillogorgiicola]SMF48015.1 acyl-CoA dehydrogenase [Pseudobacteriovorax antillogorgiicola]